MIDREGVIWAYRLLLNREPESEEVIRAYQGLAIAEVRDRFACSSEYLSLLDRAGAPLTLPHGTNWAEGAVWAYRFMLDREANDDEIAASSASPVSVNRIRLRIVLQREFEFRCYGLRLLGDFSIINAFAPFPERTPIADAFQDFLGSITRVQYLDRAWHGTAGLVYRSVPRDSEGSLHGTPEWVGTLRSVLEADGGFTAVELGAGWGPWLVVSQRAAAAKGIEKIDLIGVEASSDHYEFMLDNFRTNGLEPSRHDLHHAIVGAADGTASFPKLHVASDDYGANAVFLDTESEAAARRGELETVRSISLMTLLRDHQRVDLVHIDIQGHEAEVLDAGMDTLDEKVRRVVVGTHSRGIESRLFALFEKHGWTCESEIPCKMRLRDDGEWEMFVDGEQIWRNPRVPIADRSLLS